MPPDTIDLRGAHPVSARGLIESELLPHKAGIDESNSIYVSPGYTPCLSWHGRSAFTVHDLIHLDIEDERSTAKRAYYQSVVRRAVKRDDIATLTVSEFSRNRIAEWADVDAGTITVVGNGVDASFSPNGRTMTCDWPYLLHVGNCRPHKNLPRLLRALSRVPDVKLVFSSSRDAELESFAVSLGIADRVVFLGGIPEEDLPAWYRGAAATVIPSLYEGFGLPALEAMACGSVVVASSTTALGEVVGNAGVLVNPDSTDSIVAGIDAALGDSALIERLRDAGPTRAAEYTWEKVGQRVRSALNLPDPVHPDRGSDGGPQHESRPRIAIAHDYLTQRGGAERVVSQFATMFPQAPIVTSVYEPDLTYPEFRSHQVITSPLNRIGWLRRHFRAGLPLYGWAFDHTRVPEGTDVVLVSTTGFAHGLKTPPRCRKVVYCHSPARFLYLADDYLGGKWWRSPKGIVLKTLTPALRRWDQKAAASADLYLCNSTVVRDRIRDVYGIDATIVHPPYSLDPQGPQEPLPGLEDHPSFFLTVSRLMPYKNVDVLLRAFADLPNEHLVVIGSGPLRDELHDLAPANVSFFEGISDAQLRWAYAHAAAVIAPSKEDFGLTPVEGSAFGTPCLALHAGGYLDTVVDGVSGRFFDSATPGAVTQAVRQFRENPLEERTVLDHAGKFSPDVFSRTLRSCCGFPVDANAAFVSAPTAIQPHLEEE
ncbi:glycosyltransferase [Cutibacterium equinum]|uniref:Glycosyltransferase n=1 Tax=Cutibacterium equinum TaxID=3016342 RepID=A0ABY7R0I9_9ACTN|nr:glycosyltransferase [Cutibacterium equinum]WCC80133.1 glycosyltransferase [Cutibacterium equinum]